MASACLWISLRAWKERRGKTIRSFSRFLFSVAIGQIPFWRKRTTVLLVRPHTASLAKGLQSFWPQFAQHCLLLTAPLFLPPHPVPHRHFVPPFSFAPRLPTPHVAYATVLPHSLPSAHDSPLPIPQPGPGGRRAGIFSDKRWDATKFSVSVSHLLSIVGQAQGNLQKLPVRQRSCPGRPGSRPRGRYPLWPGALWQPATQNAQRICPERRTNCQNYCDKSECSFGPDQSTAPGFRWQYCFPVGKSWDSIHGILRAEEPTITVDKKKLLNSASWRIALLNVWPIRLPSAYLQRKKLVKLRFTSIMQGRVKARFSQSKNSRIYGQQNARFDRRKKKKKLPCGPKHDNVAIPAEKPSQGRKRKVSAYSYWSR